MIPYHGGDVKRWSKIVYKKPAQPSTPPFMIIPPPTNQHLFIPELPTLSRPCNSLLFISLNCFSCCLSSRYVFITHTRCGIQSHSLARIAVSQGSYRAREQVIPAYKKLTRSLSSRVTAQLSILKAEKSKLHCGPGLLSPFSRPPEVEYDPVKSDM